MVAFATWENPLLCNAAPGSDRGDLELARLLNVSYPTLQSWARGAKIRNLNATKVFEAALKLVRGGPQSDEDKERAIATITTFHQLYLNPPQRPYEAVALLGLTIDQYQRLIDQAIYCRLPLFPGLFYDTDSTDAVERSETALQKFRGFYHAWMKRNGGLLRCALRVRYTLEVADGLVIRCKLNIPALNPQTREELYWEYDGHMAVRRGIRRVYWVFEQRGDEDRDYFQFITDVGGPIEESGTVPSFFLSGRYLTTGQEEDRVILSDDVLLERVGVNDVAEMERLMRTSPARVTSSDEVARVENLMRVARGRREGGAGRERS